MRTERKPAPCVDAAELGTLETATPGTARPRSGAPTGSFRALAGGLTPMSKEQAAAHLERAWEETFGEPLTRSSRNLILAQWALETGHGASMRGYNFGGIKGYAQGGAGALLQTTEGSGENARRSVERFRTYARAEDGARDYVATLANAFPGVIDAVRGGDPYAFVARLHEGGYFTADRSSYERAIVHISRELGSEAGAPRAASRVARERPATADLLDPWPAAGPRKRAAEHARVQARALPEPNAGTGLVSAVDKVGSGLPPEPRQRASEPRPTVHSPALASVLGELSGRPSR